MYATLENPRARLTFFNVIAHAASVSWDHLPPPPTPPPPPLPCFLNRVYVKPFLSPPSSLRAATKKLFSPPHFFLPRWKFGHVLRLTIGAVISRGIWIWIWQAMTIRSGNFVNF